jgi:hypothetical protein
MISAFHLLDQKNLLLSHQFALARNENGLRLDADVNGKYLDYRVHRQSLYTMKYSTRSE